MDWLFKDWKKAIVFLGREYVDNDGKTEHTWIGTGILIAFKGIYCLCTAKHVIYDANKKRSYENLFIGYNSKTGGIAGARLDELKKKYSIEWAFHKNNEVDIAIIPIEVDEKLGDTKPIPEELFSKFDEIKESDDIFFMGFQPGTVIEADKSNRIDPILRKGAISLLHPNKSYLIDANAFPGNSGSPVFLGAIMHEFNKNDKGGVNINMGLSRRSGKFIGIISGYIPYDEIAVSMQTNKPRVIFEENTGLAVVWPTDYVLEILSSVEFIAGMNKAIEIEKQLKAEGKVI